MADNTLPQCSSDSSLEKGLGSSPETSPTRPQQSESPSFRVNNHLLESVRPSTVVEIELLILTFCTGIQDAISFPDYHCFASNQTGNTVFLMVAGLLSDVAGDLFVTPNIAAALGFFLLAGWITGQLGHIIGPRRRIWLVGSNLVQTLLVFGAATIQHIYPISANSWQAVVVVGLLAFASGSQVVQSRAMNMTEISTAMATAAWVDLLVDRNWCAAQNHRRNRRVFFLVSLALGALAGAGIYKTQGSAVALFVSAAGKLLVTLMYLFNGAERQMEGKECLTVAV